MMSRNALWIAVLVVVLLGAFLLMRNDRDAVTGPDDIATSTATTSVSGINGSSQAASKSESVKRAETAYTRTRTIENGVAVTIINLTDKGFVPNVVQVARGESIRFVNQTNGSMRISSEYFEDTPLVKSFEQEKTVGKGGTFQLSVSEAGVWSYHNLDSEGVSGVVYVQ
jgi:plastocyanin